MGADRPTPRLEHVENICFAEIDAHGTSARPSRVVPLEIAIDAAANDFERNSARRPAAYALERRSDDPDEVTIILAAEVGLDFATVLILEHLTVVSRRSSLVSHIINHQSGY